jgi:hypothetical protein
MNNARRKSPDGETLSNYFSRNLIAESWKFSYIIIARKTHTIFDFPRQNVIKAELAG